METFLRSPNILYSRLRRIYITSRGFKARAGQSMGLGMSKTENKSALNWIQQDHKLDKLWKATFERIAAHKLQSQTHQFAEQPAGSGQPPPGMGQFIGGTASASKTNTTLSETEQLLLKLAFSEGYFYGHQRQTKGSNFVSFLRDSLVTLLILSVLISGLRMSGVIRTNLIGNGPSEIQPEEVDVTLNDVKGCDESKKELAEIVDFLKHPLRFSRLGGKLPKGVLLIGPPGTGKTLLARAVAGEANVPFFHASGSEFDEVLVGQGARRLRDLFAKARKRTPCVIFIDEIDSVGGRRTTNALHPYANQTVNQLLSEMDGFKANEGIIVIGATNRVDDLDKALLRPGRFDVQVPVPVPDSSGRKDLFEHYLAKVRASVNIDLASLCKTTIGFSGADISNMVNQAAVRAAWGTGDTVTQQDLEQARDRIIMGPEMKSRKQIREQIVMTAYHEGGHALVSWFTEKANKLHKVTVIPRGQSLGHTSTMPESDMQSQSREQLNAAIDVTLGGRVAEEIIFGVDKVSTGCSDDLKKANMLATAMVKELGMSDKIGLRVIRDQSDGFSDATSAIVDEEVHKILDESKARVRKLIESHRSELDMLAEALLKYETLDAAEVKYVFEGKDPKILRQERWKKLRDLNLADSPDQLPLGLFK